MTRARRVQAIRARCLVRRWEFRQRNLARGAWARFREALALAAAAYVIDDTMAELLVAEGFDVDRRGEQLQPARRLVWIDADRAAQLGPATRVQLHLDAPLLAAPALALVPFPEK
jgi:hypothetical protein